MTSSDRIQAALRVFHAAVLERKRLEAQAAEERLDRGVKVTTYGLLQQAIAADDDAGQTLRKLLLETELED